MRHLVSDGTARFSSDNDQHFTRDAIDRRGTQIDAPWWGLPFRFFFTQSLNPFGATPDKTARYELLSPQTIDGTRFRVLHVSGSSPMGGYTASFFFNADNVLQRSSVEFGSGPHAARFEAQLTHIVPEKPLPLANFHFTPGPGQTLTTTADGMLALGTRAPDFSLPGWNGTLVQLSSERSGRRATLVNFWYYNCAPCRIEFPEFEKLYQRLHSQGFNIVAINKGDSPQLVASYASRTGLTFPLAMGGEIREGSVFSRYHVTETFPGTYLLDADGKIVYRNTGEDLSGLKQALARLGLQ